MAQVGVGFEGGHCPSPSVDRLASLLASLLSLYVPIPLSAVLVVSGGLSRLWLNRTGRVRLILVLSELNR